MSFNKLLYSLAGAIVFLFISAFYLIGLKSNIIDPVFGLGDISPIITSKDTWLLIGSGLIGLLIGLLISLTTKN